jgi:septal ring factor EnvC (AmiA/AmiB activator)
MKFNKVFLAVMALCFAVGMIGGYRIWGVKGNGKADIKQLLENVNAEVEAIENKNKDLAAALEAAKEDIEKSAALKAENQDLKNQLQNSLQERKGFESALAESKTKESEAEKLAEAEKELRTMNDGMNEHITVLENENQELKNKLQKMEQENTEKEGLLAQVRAELSESKKKVLQGEELKVLSDNLQGRISELEKENQDLKSVIDKISEMTRIKEENQKTETNKATESKEGEHNENRN